METNISQFDAPYQTNFELEKFDYAFWRQWHSQRWWYSIVIGAIYVVLIQAGTAWMKNKEPFRLKRPLLWWNVMLAAFSILAFLRTLPEYLSLLGMDNGYYLTVCSRDHMTITHVFWEWMGTWSKVFELGDTAFIVLRKQPLIFLHWYHHFSVLIYTWFSMDANDPAHRWYLFMNSGIHAMMYSYYALRAIGVKIPKPFALTITTLQIAQMFVGLFTNLYSLYAKNTDLGCSARPTINIVLALLMYSSYLVLFCQFFSKAYLSPSKRRPAVQQPAAADSVHSGEKVKTS